MPAETEYFSRLSDEDKQLVSRISDLINICRNKSVVKYTHFLDMRQQKLALSVLNNENFENFMFWGGYENAERKVLCIAGEYCEIVREEFCFDAVGFDYRKADMLTHRDFLGTFMGKQIKREMIGDISVNEGKSIAFVYNTVSSVILNEVTKVGSVGVRVYITDNPEVNKTENYMEISGTVASMRLDAVVSLALNLSREKVSLLIKNNGADVNYEKVYSVIYSLKEGDVFSLRGYGKFVLYSIGGKTRKDRIHITIKKYI